MQRSARSILYKSISSYPFPRSPRPISPSLPKTPKFPPNPPIPTLFPPQKSHLPGVSSLPISTHFKKLIGNHRNFSNGDEPTDHSKEIDEINLKFAEAREEIEAALESKETVYFDEEAECAREAVKIVLEMFEALLAKLPEKEKMALHRSMGLKIQQLKAEVEQLND